MYTRSQSIEHMNDSYRKRRSNEKGNAMKVRWSSDASVHSVETLGNIASLWYSKDDMAGFRAHYEVSKRLARMGFDDHGITSCSWGLEHTYSDDLAQERKNRRQEAWDTVLGEQYCQKQEQVQSVPPELLSELYHDITIESQTEAHDRAQRYRTELLLEQDEAYRPSKACLPTQALCKKPDCSLDRKLNIMMSG